MIDRIAPEPPRDRLTKSGTGKLLASPCTHHCGVGNVPVSLHWYVYRDLLSILRCFIWMTRNPTPLAVTTVVQVLISLMIEGADRESAGALKTPLPPYFYTGMC